MKAKAELKTEILPLYGSEKDAGLYMVLKQWTDGGLITTDNNDGKGYTLEEAQNITINLHGKQTA